MTEVTSLGSFADAKLPAQKPTCPFCNSEDVEVVAQFGGQIITSQARCRSCNTYFEALREEFEPEGEPQPTHPLHG